MQQIELCESVGSSFYFVVGWEGTCSELDAVLVHKLELKFFERVLVPV